jgi:2-iminobutanoate/2-iminopropanoate deaminase
MVPEVGNPVAPYSHAVEVDGWLFIRGQIPNDPNDDNAPLPDGIEAQTRRVMEGLGTLLAGVDASFDNIVSARVFLTHFKEDFAKMNVIYKTYFKEGRLPARTCVGVTDLARGARIEIDFIGRR